MWKIISVFTLLTVAQAANIKEIYGDWWEVAFYPVNAFAPSRVCKRFRFAGHTEEVKCNDAFGRNASILITLAMTEKGELIGTHWTPVIVVDTASEVMTALNSNVTCDGRKVLENCVARVVNENYFILYTTVTDETRTELEQNTAIIFGKQVVSSEKLTAVMSSIDELKNRQGHLKCVTENFGGFNRTQNND